MSSPAQDGPEHLAEGGALSAGEERFERWRRLSGVFLAPAAFAAAYLAALPQVGDGGISPQGPALAGVLAAVGVLWMTETVPLPVTSLLAACLCILLGVADARAILAPFGDPIVFLFIGSFILARAMTLHGLDRRLALGFLSTRWVGGRPARVLAALGAVTALISMWVSNTATAAMMAPIGLGILHALSRRQGGSDLAALRAWPFASAVMLMIAYASAVGGMGTPVGSPPNLITLAQLRALAGVEISFFTWACLNVPVVIVMVAVLFVLLRLLHRGGEAGPQKAEELAEYLRKQRAALGPWTRGQVNTVLAFGVAITFWVLPGVLALFLGEGGDLPRFLQQHAPEAVVALVAALLLFVLPTDLPGGKFTISWQEAARIDWGTILLFGAGLMLGEQMKQTGVAKAIADGLTAVTGAQSLWALTAAAVALGIVLSETSSNTAAASMILPTIIPMAVAADLNPVPPALGACMGASFGFMLPVSTPPNAVVYGTGLVPITRMVRAGVLFDVIGFFLIVAALRVLCPLLGLS